MKTSLSKTILSVFILTLIANISFAQLANVTGISDNLTSDGDPGNTTLSIVVQNNGSVDFNGGLLGLYVSLDTVLDTNDDSLLFSFGESAVAAGDTNSFIVTIDFCNAAVIGQLPVYALYNDFYLIYKLDLANNTPENNESDNVGVFTPPLHIGCTLGINSLSSNKLSIYPNPNKGKFSVSHSNLTGQLTISIMNILTQNEIYTDPEKAIAANTFDVSFLPAGLYMIRVQSGSEAIFSKLVIER